jgi:hypothetical protein
MLAVLAIGAGCVAAVLVWVLMMAGSANASPRLLAAISRMTYVLGASVVLCVAGGGAAVYFGRPWVAAGLGVMPVVVGVVALMVVDRASA